MAITESEIRALNFQRLNRFEKREKTEEGKEVVSIVMAHRPKFGAFTWPKGLTSSFLVTHYRPKRACTGILYCDDRGEYWFRMFELNPEELDFFVRRNVTIVTDASKKRVA